MNPTPVNTRTAKYSYPWMLKHCINWLCWQSVACKVGLLFMFGSISFKPVQTVKSPDYNRCVELSRKSWGNALATEVWHVPGSIPGSGKDVYVLFFVLFLLCFYLCLNTQKMSWHFAISFEMLIHTSILNIRQNALQITSIRVSRYRPSIFNQYWEFLPFQNSSKTHTL